ncbi:MAG: glycerophosphodiester phosphodiesterase [Gammaproteobacteria bacterium]|nr:glycerophosphodiester phosphodiesterase [Gammaproteobacteria bacterium]MDH3536312.1 glycerophosphodiester phosphodiesterase [Gammaproteobacteria bacterium]
MPDLSENFYIIGHRGAAGERLENSLDGFKHALTLAIDAIEIDIREHAAELWVFHDHDLERLTGTPGLFEDQADLSAIRLRNGEALPTLRQLLDLYWGKMPINIEIKAVDNPGLLLDLLAGYPALPDHTGLPWILLSSFNHRALLKLRERGCPWPLAPIDSGIPPQVEFGLEQIRPWSWHFDNEYLDLDLVKQLRAQGVPSLVFTVNDIERASELKHSGVAGIFTDYPSKMIQID